MAILWFFQFSMFPYSDFFKFWRKFAFFEIRLLLNQSSDFQNLNCFENPRD